MMRRVAAAASCVATRHAIAKGRMMVVRAAARPVAVAAESGVAVTIRAAATIAAARAAMSCTATSGNEVCGSNGESGGETAPHTRTEGSRTRQQVAHQKQTIHCKMQQWPQLREGQRSLSALCKTNESSTARTGRQRRQMQYVHQMAVR